MRRALVLVITLTVALALVTHDVLLLLTLRESLTSNWRDNVNKLASFLLERLSESSNVRNLVESISEGLPVTFLDRNTCVIITDPEGFVLYSYPSPFIEDLGLSWEELAQLLDSMILLDALSDSAKITAKESLAEQYGASFSGDALLLTRMSGVTLVSPIRSKVGGFLLGFLVIHEDTRYILNLWQRLLYLSGLSVVLVLVASHFLSWLLTSKLLRPLLRLRDWASRVLSSNYEELPSESWDVHYPELRPIISSLREMTVRLADYSRELKRQRDSLERLLISLPLWIVIREGEKLRLFGSVPEELIKRLPDEPTQVELEGRTFEVIPVKLRDMSMWLIRDVTEDVNRERVRDEILSVLSHELRTPLTVVKGFLLTLRELIVRGDTSKVDRALSYVNREVDRLISMVQEMLTLARLRLRRVRMNYTFISLDELKEELVSLIQLFTPKAEELNVKLVISLNLSGSDMVKLDLDKFKQVLINLLDNAIRHAESEVRFKAYSSEGKLVVEVSNDGRRLSPRQLMEIFERYVSASGSLGIGLTISKEIVEIHGGKIEARNWERGVFFRVILPLSEEQEED